MPTTLTIECAYCHKPHTYIYWQGTRAKVHPECRELYHRQQARIHAKEVYDANPIAGVTKARDWRQANPVAYKNARNDNLSLHCSVCGRIVVTARLRTANNASFTCVSCKAALQRIIHICTYCGIDVPTIQSHSKKYKNRYCKSCYGLQTAAARLMGISHQHLSDLIKKENTYATKRDALASIMLTLGYNIDMLFESQ